MSIEGYSPFSHDTITFFRDLEENNNKPWFEAHKEVYTSTVLKPAQSLVTELSGLMLEVDPLLEVFPAVGKTISRHYRDTRFSKDKSPFRSQIWITFKRPGKEWVNAPAFFFELTAASYRYGMGFYSASKETMDSIREGMDLNPKSFRQAISFYPKQQIFTLEGEVYKRRLNPDTADDLVEWYQRKNLYLVRNCGINDRLFGYELVEDLSEGFGGLKEFYHFLSKANAK